MKNYEPYVLKKYERQPSASRQEPSTSAYTNVYRPIATIQTKPHSAQYPTYPRTQEVKKQLVYPPPGQNYQRLTLEKERNQMRQSATKEQFPSQKQIPQQKHTIKLNYGLANGGNVRVADLGQNQPKTYTDPSKKMRDSLLYDLPPQKPNLNLDKAPEVRKGIAVVSDNKTQSKEDEQSKRAQEFIKEQYKKLETDKHRHKEEVTALQKQKAIASNQVDILQRQKQAVIKELAKLKEETTKIKNNQTIFKTTQFKNDPYPASFSRNTQNTQVLQNQIEELKKDIKRKDAELEKYQRPKYGLADSRELRANQKELEESRKLKKSYAQLQEKASDSDKKVVILEDQIRLNQSTVKKLQTEKDKLQNQVKLLGLQNNDLKKKNTGRFNVDQSDWKDKYQRVYKDLEKLKQQNQELKANKNTITSYGQYNKILKQKQKQWRDIEAQNKKLMDQNNAIKHQLSSCQRQIAALGKEPQKNNKRQNLIQRPQSRGQSQQTNKKIAALTAEVEQLKTENATLLQSQKASSPSKTRAFEYIEKVRILQSQLQNEKKEATKIRSQLQQRRKEAQKYKDLVKFKQDSLNNLQKEKSTLLTQLNESNEKMKELKQKSDSPNKQLNSLKIQLQNQRNKLNAKIQSLQAQNTNYRTQINRVKDENYRLTSDKNTLSQLKAKNSQLTQQNQTLKRQIKEETSKFQRKQQEIRNIRTQLERSNSQKSKQIESIKSQVAQLQSNIRRKDQDNMKNAKMIQEKQKSLQKYQSQIDKLQTRVAIVQSQKQSQKVTVNSQARLKQENRNMSKEAIALRQNAKLKEQSYQKLMQQYQRLKEQKTNQMQALNKELLNKQKIIKDLQTNNTKNLTTFEDFKGKSSKLEEEKKVLQKKNDELKKENESEKLKIKNECDKLQKQLKDRETTIENLKLQIQKNQFLAKARPSTQVIGFSNDRKYKMLEQDNAKLRKKLEQKQTFLAQFENQQRALSSNYHQLSDQLNTVQTEKDQLQRELDDLHDKYETLFNARKGQNNRKGHDANQQVRRLDTQYNQLNQEHQELLQDFRGMSQSRDQLQKKYNSLQTQNQRLRDESSKRPAYQNNLKDSQQVMKLRTDKANLERKVAELGQDIIVQQKSYKQMENKYSKATSDLIQLKTKCDQLQKKIRQKTNQNQIKNREVTALKQKSENFLRELTQLKQKLNENQRKNRISEQSPRQIQLKNRQISSLRQENTKISNELAQAKSFISQLEKKSSPSKVPSSFSQNPLNLNPANQFRHLFNGDVLRGEDQYKIFIKQCIQNHQHFTIVDTRLIYRFDPLNKENIHKYIDEKPQLVVVVKLINGFILSGYAQGIFKPKTPSDKSGLILSLTNQKCYTLMEKNKRSIAYDDFFVIFGNSEIRIKSQQKKVFSNFGLSNSYYRHNGDGVSMLMGGSKSEREMEIIGYEFFQLILKE